MKPTKNRSLTFALLLAVTAFTLGSASLEAQLGHALKPSSEPFPYHLAEPLAMPVFDETAAGQEVEVEAAPQKEDNSPIVSRPGRAPIVDRMPRVQVLDAETVSSIVEIRQVSQRNVGIGKGGGQFTSSRVIPPVATRAYPYSAVGKVFMTFPDEGDFECSAAVIAPRIILTAGHCVHLGQGGADGFVSRLSFLPGYHEGNPIGEWQATYIITTDTWLKGGGRVPNAADYALVELADNQRGRIGDVVGWLGWITKRLQPNHITMLGYPGALDGGQWMHVSSGQSVRGGGAATVLYGSDMTEGSSGGPWVQNFGEPAEGQEGGANDAPNLIAGVMSYVYTQPGVFLAGSSVLDQRFLQMLDQICAHQDGNCD